MEAVPNPEMHQQQSGFAPRRQYEQIPANVSPIAINMANGQPQVGAIPIVLTKIMQRPVKVKKEKIGDLTASTSKLAIEESLKLVSLKTFPLLTYFLQIFLIS